MNISELSDIHSHRQSESYSKEMYDEKKQALYNRIENCEESIGYLEEIISLLTNASDEMSMILDMDVSSLQEVKQIIITQIDIIKEKKRELEDDLS